VTSEMTDREWLHNHPVYIARPIMHDDEEKFLERVAIMIESGADVDQARREAFSQLGAVYQ
jgi:hypothetical protein